MAKNRPAQYRTPLIQSGVALVLALAPLAAAQAYVGPGAGLSLLGALWGLLAAVGAALLFVVLWPIRRMRRRKREAARAQADAQESRAESGLDQSGDKHS